MINWPPARADPSLTIHQFTIPQLTITMLLSLDTATRHSGIALYDGQQIVAELNWHSVDAQTTELLPRLEQVMAWSGVQPAGLAALAVSIGPGSFTGLRVALSLAKGMALAHGLPLIGVPTLDATAYPHLGCGEPVCAVVQAGRGRVLWSVYEPGAAGARPLP
jgi:tRNA threonylcarbamoyladenosine biosynthesis protein TsaB